MKTRSDNRLLDSFFAKLARTPGRLLLLDYDGTLAPFRVERDEARPYEGVVGLLNGLLRCPGNRVVVISGRALADLIPLLEGVEPLPELWGSHGWERRQPGGAVEQMVLTPAVDRGLAAAWSWARDAGVPERCERKPASVAFHFRDLEDREIRELEHRINQELAPLVASDGLDWHRFDGGLELRARGADKGAVVAKLIAEAPASTSIAYAGDDLTDEDAFRALGDRGLRVLVRGEFRETAADVWLRPPEELLEFLTRWLNIAKGTS